MTARSRVLIVEDEAMIAMGTEHMLTALGHEVTGVAATIADAQAAVARGGFDLALLDVNLGGKDSGAVADRLAAEGVPFVFTTGYGRARVPEAHRAAPLLHKPFGKPGLARAIGQALS